MNKTGVTFIRLRRTRNLTQVIAVLKVFLGLNLTSVMTLIEARCLNWEENFFDTFLALITGAITSRKEW